MPSRKKEVMEQLKALADRKRLDLDILRNYWQVSDDVWQGQPCLRIPYDGGVFRYRTANGMRVDKGVKMKGRLYGLHQVVRRLRHSDRPPVLWLVEGESDTWAAHQAGLFAAGLPGATTWTSTGRQAAGLAKLLAEVGGSCVWVMDNDHAGKQALDRLLTEDLGHWLDIPFFYLPSFGYKDLGDAWQELGLTPDEFREWLLDKDVVRVEQLQAEAPAKFNRNPFLSGQPAVTDARDRWLTEYVNEVRNAATGSRNNTLRKCCYEAARRLEGSSWSETDLAGQMEAAGIACGLPSREVKACVKAAIRDGLRSPYQSVEVRQTPEFTPVVVKPAATPDTPEVQSEDIDDFWTSDPLLTDIWHYAVTRLSSPLALLGACLAYSCLCVSHLWRVPPPNLSKPMPQSGIGVVPADAPHLGSYVLLVGGSGQGKSPCHKPKSGQ